MPVKSVPFATLADDAEEQRQSTDKKEEPQSRDQKPKDSKERPDSYLDDAEGDEKARLRGTEPPLDDDSEASNRLANNNDEEEEHDGDERIGRFERTR